MQVFIWNDKMDKNQKNIFYIHGGAYIHQPTSFHFKSISYIAEKTDAKVIFPIYPKAPRYNYKESFEKVEKLYRDILTQTSSSNNITIMGDSAGGGFSLGFSMYARDIGLPQPKNIILLSPWLDVNTDNPDIAKYESLDPMLSQFVLNTSGKVWAGGKENMNNPYVSPIFGDFNKLGKISIFVGTHEIFYPDNEKMHNLLEEQSIEHNYYVGDKMNHVYVVFPIPEAKEAQDKIIEIINQK